MPKRDQDVGYSTLRGLDRALSQKLASPGWIEQRQNLIIKAPTWVGESSQLALRGIGLAVTIPRQSDNPGMVTVYGAVSMGTPI